LNTPSRGDRYFLQPRTNRVVRRRGSMSWIRRKLWLLAAAMLPASAVGCNPLAMGFLTPVPIQPWVAERMEEKYCHKNDGRVPIMPPIRDGFPPPICEDPPSDQEVL